VEWSLWVLPKPKNKEILQTGGTKKSGGSWVYQAPESTASGREGRGTRHVLMWIAFPCGRRAQVRMRLLQVILPVMARCSPDDVKGCMNACLG
jgi:hypothetical protein